MYNHLVLFGNRKEPPPTETEESGEGEEDSFGPFSVKLEAE